MRTVNRERRDVWTIIALIMFSWTIVIGLEVGEHFANKKMVAAEKRATELKEEIAIYGWHFFTNYEDSLSKRGN